MADFDEVHRFPESGEDLVKVVKKRSSGTLVVIKTVRAERQADQTGYVMPNEVDILTHKLDKHPNLINLSSYSLEHSIGHDPKCHMELEYCDAGNIHHFVDHWSHFKRYRGEHVPPLFVLHFVSSMISALGYIHEGVIDTDNSSSTNNGISGWQPILHRDIKGGNIFLR